MRTCNPPSPARLEARGASLFAGARRAWLFALVFGAALFAERRASATPEFPEFIKGELGLDEVPHCALCHVGTPGRGTVQTPFGKYARSRGLLPRNTRTLKGVLAAANGERRDSDGDGMTDVEELEAGNDPNGDQPEFGCVGRVAGGGTESPLACSMLVGIVFLAWSRRRSRVRGCVDPVESTE